MEKIKIGIGADHAGYDYKEAIIEALEAKGYSIKNFGTFNKDSVDYPDFVHPVCNALDTGDYKMGILICGSANGVAMTANKHQNIRAAIAWEKEISKLSRQHNDANVICVPARFVTLPEALQIVETFLATEFEGGRHQRRVEKIACV
ncbi:MAG: ribose 5-phosphate isomerase B [Chitinophagales bacterium]